MSHLRIQIAANESSQETLIALLEEQTTGFEQLDDHLLAYVRTADYQPELMADLLKGFEFTVEEVGERNWNAEWEKNFPPVVVDDFVAVRAHFHEAIPGVQFELKITPKMSFGTGHHATTWQMMRMMRSLDFKGRDVFDFGTGTGVLAILADKLGAARVEAIDNDPWSIENARENCQRNWCSNTVVELADTLPVNQSYDIVLANINRNILLHFAQQLGSLVRPEGTLLLSGLLPEDQQPIAIAFAAAGFQLVAQSERNNWICLRFTRQLGE